MHIIYHQYIILDVGGIQVPNISKVSELENTKLRPQVKQARAANKNGRCNGAAHLL